MKTQTIEITLTINTVSRKLMVSKDESLLDVLRRASYSRRGARSGRDLCPNR